MPTVFGMKPLELGRNVPSGCTTYGDLERNRRLERLGSLRQIILSVASRGRCFPCVTVFLGNSTRRFPQRNCRYQSDLFPSALGSPDQFLDAFDFELFCILWDKQE